MEFWDHLRNAVSSRLLVEVGQERGADPEQVLFGTGLSVDSLRDKSTMVTGSQELQIARQLKALLGDVTGVGLEAGRRVTIGDLGIWAFAIMSSATIGEAIRIAVRFNQLAPAFVAAELGDETGMLVVTLHDDHLPVDVRELLAERDLAAVAQVDAMVGMDLEDVTVLTKFGGPIADELAQMYAPATVVRGSARHQLRIPGAVVERCLPTADESVGRLCQAECERLLDSYRHRSNLSAVVRTLLARKPAAMPSHRQLAQELHLSERSLRRRLHEEGTSYRALREEVTTTIATELMGTVGLSVGEVAHRLGYSDASSFTHAFTRWNGTAPGAHTRKVRSRES
ncbi:AraC family transcriptional regulator ligand-binding domain-containing protein [Mycobacterium sp. smrl_JER01]|uniref:AraC family transcriptional regulator n=1 Tax=Mycobacterium sp. smrl_JER01 TaxID=3402633 RepID=UPI003AD6084E